MNVDQKESSFKAKRKKSEKEKRHKDSDKSTDSENDPQTHDSSAVKTDFVDHGAFPFHTLHQQYNQVKANISQSYFLQRLELTSQKMADEQVVVKECRRMFREEMVRLRTEFENFRDLCISQVEAQKQFVEDHKMSCGKQLHLLPPESGPGESSPEVLDKDLQDQLKQLESNMEFFQHKQKVLDLEMDLLNKEDELSRRQKDLEEYEKEIQEVELMLNQRQAICDRRQKQLLSLDEELSGLRQDLGDTKNRMQQEGIIVETASERAEHNWDIVRRNLMDRQKMLESTVQKYRSELAAASSSLTGKDIMIAKLQNQIADFEEQLQFCERKIKQLESKLALSLNESRILEEQLICLARTGHLSEMKNCSSSLSKDTGGDSAISSRGGLRSPLPRRSLAPDELEEHRFFNSIPPQGRKNSSPRNSVLIRRVDRSNSIAGDILSKLTLRTPRSGESDDRGSGACNVM